MTKIYIQDDIDTWPKDYKVKQLGELVSTDEGGKVYKYNTGCKDVKVTIISGEAWFHD